MLATKLRPRSAGIRMRFWLTFVVGLGLLLQFSGAQASATQRVCSVEPTDDLVVYGDLITCDLDPGTDQDQFRFNGALGEVVVIQATALSGGTPCLELLRPDGTTLEPLSCAASRRLDTTLDQAGEYRIRVTELGANNVTQYSLVVDRVGPASPAATPIDPGMVLDGIISPLGEIDFYAFQGEAGDVVSLVGTVTGGVNTAIRMELIDPNGVLVTAGQAVVQRTLTSTLTQSGLYSVLVYEVGNNNPDMVYNLAYSCSGVCPSLVLKRRYIDSASIEDLNASGAPETVALFQNRNNKVSNLIIKDGDTRATLKTIPVFGSAIEPLGVAAVGDQTGDQISELAVLGVRLSDGAIRVWVVDPDAGLVTGSLPFFDSTFSALGVTRVEDLNNDSVPEIGVLGVNRTTNGVILRIKEELTGTTLKTIAFPK